MSNLLNILKDYSGLINLTILFAFFTIFIKIIKATISQKDAQIETLNQQLKNQIEFSVEKTTEKFLKLKEYYEKTIVDSYEVKLELLKNHNEKALSIKENECKNIIDTEKAKIENLYNSFKDFFKKENINLAQKFNVSEICGRYDIQGINPKLNNGYKDDATYSGELIIYQNNEILRATWRFKSFKKNYNGIGILKGNTIAFAFEFESKTGASGIIIYDIINSELLRGCWTVFGLNSIGIEECKKNGKRNIEE